MDSKMKAKTGPVEMSWLNLMACSMLDRCIDSSFRVQNTNSNRANIIPDPIPDRFLD